MEDLEDVVVGHRRSLVCGECVVVAVLVVVAAAVAATLLLLFL